MEAAIVGLVGVLVGAGISTVVTYFLAVRKEQAEQRNWRRDRCLEAYSDFLRAMEMTISEAGKAWGTKCGTEEHNKQCLIVHEKVDEMYRTTNRIFMLAPVELHDPFDALVRHLGTELPTMSMGCPKVSDDERKASNTRFSKLIGSFLMTARHDIGIDSHGEISKTLLRLFR